MLHQAGASTIDGASYTVDAAGNRTSKTDRLAGVTSNYAYDLIFGGTYVRVGLNSPGFKINPFSVPPTKENLDFLVLFLRVLIQGSSPLELTPAEERDLYHQIENLYEIEPALRTLTVLSNTLDRRLADRLARWTTGGQFDFVFDNAEDTITFSRFQCFDFRG